MTGIDIFKSKQVSVGFGGVNAPVSYNCSLYEAFRKLMSGSDSHLLDLQQRVQSSQYHSKEQAELKKQLPYILTSGTAQAGEQPNDNKMTLNGLIALDVDLQDNASCDLGALRKSLMSQCSVVGVYKSASGTGLWVLILLQDVSKFGDYFKYFQRLFKSKYNLVIDESCSNSSRKRFIGFDPDWKEYTNWGEITPWNLTPYWSEEETPKQTSLVQQLRLFKPNNFESNHDRDLEVLRAAIEVCVDNGFYIDKLGAWYYAAGECKLVSGGYELFRKLSSNNARCGHLDTEQLLKSTYDKSPLPNIGDVIGKWVNRSKKYKK